MERKNKKMNKNEKKNQKLLKKMNSEKIKAEKKANQKTPKERRKDFIIRAKEFCIKDTSRMILLVAILFAMYLQEKRMPIKVLLMVNTNFLLVVIPHC